MKPTYTQAIQKIHYIKKQMVDHQEIDRLDLYMRELDVDDVKQMAIDYGVACESSKDHQRIWCKLEIRVGERSSWLFLVSEKIKISCEKLMFSNN